MRERQPDRLRVNLSLLLTQGSVDSIGFSVVQRDRVQKEDGGDRAMTRVGGQIVVNGIPAEPVVLRDMAVIENL